MTTETGIRARMKAERPGQILDAAFEEFVEKGFAATRVEDIARKVGVTKGTVYVYFKDKEALFDAVMQHAARSQIEALTSVGVRQNGSYREKLEHFLKTFYAVVAHDEHSRKILRLLFLESHREGGLADRFHESSLAPLERILVGILEKGVEAGEFRTTGGPEGHDIIVGPAINAMISAMLFQTSSKFDVDRYIETHLDLLLHGLLAR